MDRDLYKLVHGFCQKHYKYWEYLYEYDDYVQDSFVKILSVLDKYDNKRSSLSSFVYSTLLNHWLWFRKFNKFKQDRFERTFLSIEYDEEIEGCNYNLYDRITDDDNSIMDEMEEIEEQDWLKAIIPHLNEYSYNHYVLGESLSTIANRYNSSRQNIHAKIQRNLKKIKKLIDNGTISCYNY